MLKKTTTATENNTFYFCIQQNISNILRSTFSEIAQMNIKYIFAQY